MLALDLAEPHQCFRLDRADGLVGEACGRGRQLAGTMVIAAAETGPRALQGARAGVAAPSGGRAHFRVGSMDRLDGLFGKLELAAQPTAEPSGFGGDAVGFLVEPLPVAVREGEQSAGFGKLAFKLGQTVDAAGGFAAVRDLVGLRAVDQAAGGVHLLVRGVEAAGDFFMEVAIGGEACLDGGEGGIRGIEQAGGLKRVGGRSARIDGGAGGFQ